MVGHGARMPRTMQMRDEGGRQAKPIIKCVQESIVTIISVYIIFLSLIFFFDGILICSLFIGWPIGWLI